MVAIASARRLCCSDCLCGLRSQLSPQRCQRLRPPILASRSVETCALRNLCAVFVAAAIFAAVAG